MTTALPRRPCEVCGLLIWPRGSRKRCDGCRLRAPVANRTTRRIVRGSLHARLRGAGRQVCRADGHRSAAGVRVRHRRRHDRQSGAVVLSVPVRREPALPPGAPPVRRRRGAGRQRGAGDRLDPVGGTAAADAAAIRPGHRPGGAGVLRRRRLGARGGLSAADRWRRQGSGDRRPARSAPRRPNRSPKRTARTSTTGPTLRTTSTAVRGRRTSQTPSLGPRFVARSHASR